MKKPRSAAQAELVNGCQPGSELSRMSQAERREFNAWLKERNADSRAYERQLANADKRRSPHEV